MSYLKIGDWEIHENGIRGTLHLEAVDELGRIFGTVFNHRITGWWSERARRLTFVREGSQSDPAANQAYEGYAWDEPTDPGKPRVYYLAGSYETFAAGGGAKDRQCFGGFANLRQPLLIIASSIRL